MAAGAAPSREHIQLAHVFTKYYPTGLNLPANELFLDLPPGTLLPTDDAKASILAAGTDWGPQGVLADLGYGYETEVQSRHGGLPSFCRFGATILTSDLSQVYTEIWLPLPDTAPTNTTDPDPIPFDNSTSSSSGPGTADQASPAVRLEPLPPWLRSRLPWRNTWQDSARRQRRARRDELKRRQDLAAARRPPPDFVPAPDTAWKGRMVHIGSAAAKGAIIYPNMKQILARYREVVVADNSGHFSAATSEAWATNDPTRRDSGYRATHLSTMLGQVVTKTFYGVTPGPSNKPQRRQVKNRALFKPRAEQHHHTRPQQGQPATATTASTAPPSSIATTAPPGLNPEDGNYSDIAPFMSLREPYSDKLGFMSYFIGCSMGGRQAISEAALFPADYDGILAGSPAISFSNTSAWQIWVNQKVADPKAAAYLPPSSYALIRAAVLQACDGLDGVLDGVVSNTTACSFDLFAPALACSPASVQGDKDCLSPAQLDNLAGVYSNYTIGGDLVHTGLLPGSEPAWSAMGGLSGVPLGVAPGWFQYQVLNLSSSPSSFDPFVSVTPSVIALANELDPGRGNTWYPDLSAFLSHGRLLHTHGLADQLIPPGDSVRYYQAVAERVAQGDVEVLSDAYRLFLVPGMAHCRLGDGPFNFGGPAQTDTGSRPLSFDARHDATLALFDWAERGAGSAPEYLVGAAYKTKEEQAGYAVATTSIRDDRRFEYGVKNTRKLCPWPREAHLKPNFTRTDLAASFVCQ
ncbi:hypothetical protein OC835_006380 [Tilletia horrida]|nr:hypothetical protein OC835_006380 [Tilletia horrida]